MLQRLTNALEFNAQALTLRAERQRVIASNIANADTPGYQAREMDFPRALRAATGVAGTEPRLATTQPGHLAIGARGGMGASTLGFAAASQTNLDGNGVDMDRERASFAENAVKYEATLRFINGQVRSTLDAMKSPSQG